MEFIFHKMNFRWTQTPTPLSIISISMSKHLLHFLNGFGMRILLRRSRDALGPLRLQINYHLKTCFFFFFLLLRKPQIANYHLKIGGGPVRRGRHLDPGRSRTKREPFAGRSREAHPHEPESDTTDGRTDVWLYYFAARKGDFLAQ